MVLPLFRNVCRWGICSDQVKMGKWTFMPPVQTLNQPVFFLGVFHLRLHPCLPPPPPPPPSTSTPAQALLLSHAQGPLLARACPGGALLPPAGGGELVLCCRPLVVASWCSAAAHCWRRAATCTRPGVVPPHAQVLLPLKSSPLDRSCSSRSSQFCSPRFISSPSTRSASE